MARDLIKGLGESVAKRSFLRQDEKGEYETWGDVAHRVALGNSSLLDSVQKDYQILRDHIANASILMSGRHLQHGDSTQPTRNIEVFSNCSTSITSTTQFYLALNGSGIGRSYSDSLMAFDWSKLPQVHCVLDPSHKDYNPELHESSKDIKHLLQFENSVEWISIPDSREGWAEMMQTVESYAYDPSGAPDHIVLDFSMLRPDGSPIKGMQGRPASGPAPLMEAIEKIKEISPKGYPAWKANMIVDHYLAASVVSGGSRRVARIATKYWKDPDIIEFINFKESGEFWSSNNSVEVDKEFWDLLDQCDAKVTEIYNEAVKLAYETGEPGFLNVDKLMDKGEPLKEISLSGHKFEVSESFKTLNRHLLELAGKSKYSYTTNPCLSLDTNLLTKDGIRPLKEVNEGDEIWSDTGWTKVVKKWKTGHKMVKKYYTNAGYFLGTDNHEIYSNGVKVPVGEAENIDVCLGEIDLNNLKEISYQDVMDGLVLGDGGIHKASGDLVGLYIGEDDHDYFDSEIKDMIKNHRPGIKDTFYEVYTRISSDELPNTYDRVIPDRYFNGDQTKKISFLRGLFTANGCVTAKRVQYKGSSKVLVMQAQEMLSSLGIRSSLVTNKPKKIKFANGEYECKESYNLIVYNDNSKFMKYIGFLQNYKNEKPTHDSKPLRSHSKILKVEDIGMEDVYDITVDNKNHRFWTGGHLVSNCGEITLSNYGGYCVIGDLAPYHCDSIEEFKDAGRALARALIRTNTMSALYQEEVDRTNRIGVSITGVQEFAWKFFKYGFYDLIDENKSQDFWDTMAEVRDAIIEEAKSYSKELGMNEPHTIMTCKPSGSVSKLFGLTEGWHLPARHRYLRWVQFRTNEEATSKYRSLGYPTQELNKYQNVTIVGFPTELEIAKLGLGDRLVLAKDATPQEQYQWLKLGEKYWIGEEYGNQISYTLKIDPNVVSREDFGNIIKENQPLIKCCAIMPELSEEDYTRLYEYSPEQAVTDEEWDQIVANIIPEEDLEEEVDRAHIDCAGGACPIDFKDRA